MESDPARPYSVNRRISVSIPIRYSCLHQQCDFALNSDEIIRLLIDASELVYNDSNINYVKNLADESVST